MEGDAEEVYQTLFEDNYKGGVVLISSRFILRLHVEKDEATWTKFVSKPQSHQAYDAWVRMVVDVPGNVTNMLVVRVKKALLCLRIHSITRVHEDLELLVSRWSMESHIFVAVCGSLDQLSRMS